MKYMTWRDLELLERPGASKGLFVAEIHGVFSGIALRSSIGDAVRYIGASTC